MKPKTYTITLADLCQIADAACELDGMRQFYVDRPDEQERIARMVNQLHDMAERAAREDAGRIYAQDDGSAACPCS